MDDTAQDLGATATSQDEALAEAVKRFRIFENLLSALKGNIMETETESMESTRFDEEDFWGLVHKFVYLSGDEHREVRDETLCMMRQALARRENRSVLYSIAVVSQLRSVIPGFPSQMANPTSDGEQEPLKRLVMAKAFLERGFNDLTVHDVVQKICAMAISTWTTLSAVMGARAITLGAAYAAAEAEAAAAETEAEEEPSSASDEDDDNSDGEDNESMDE